MSNDLGFRHWKLIRHSISSFVIDWFIMSTRAAHLVVDLAYGDCGKGTIVDFLARRSPGDCTVVRFNGGPQAGHNVVTPDGRHHTFSQFGSGSFVPGVRTFLSRFMLIEPYALLKEAHHLQDLGVPDPLVRLTIDARCPIITPAHQAANRIRELSRGDAAHGTCGVGVGETVQDTLEHPDVILHAGDLGDQTIVREKLRAACELKLGQLAHFLAMTDPPLPPAEGRGEGDRREGDTCAIADPTGARRVSEGPCAGSPRLRV